MAEKSKRQQEKRKMDEQNECPFLKKRKIEDESGDLIAMDVNITNSDENMPLSLNEDQMMEEQNDVGVVVESGEG